MASRASDAFSRLDGALGTADTGQSWVAHRGSGSIKSGRAYFPASNPGALYTLDTGIGGGDAYVSMDILSSDGAGQALYFRVVDVNRWWRLAKRQYTYSYTYQSGMTEPVYGWVGTGEYYYTPSSGWVRTGTYPLNSSHPEYNSYRTEYYKYDSRVSAYLGRTDYNNGTMLTYQERTVHEIQANRIVTPAQPIYSTGYATQTEVRLEKCVNGQVSTVKSAGVSGSISSLAVNLDKTVITCFVDGSSPWTAFNDSTHQGAHLHGIGYAETSSFGNGSGIESFRAEPFVLTGYLPPLMP